MERIMEYCTNHYHMRLLMEYDRICLKNNDFNIIRTINSWSLLSLLKKKKLKSINCIKNNYSNTFFLHYNSMCYDNYSINN